jgi:hypothetical protein
MADATNDVFRYDGLTDVNYFKITSVILSTCLSNAGLTELDKQV